jgi:hypothetical protein
MRPKLIQTLQDSVRKVVSMIAKKTDKRYKNKRRGMKKQTTSKSTFKVRLEDVANIGGPDSMLGKSMSRFCPNLNISSSILPV